VIKRQLFCSERLWQLKWRNQLENETSTGSNDRNSICFRRSDWILKSHLWIEICRVASFCEWFLHVYRRYLLIFIDLVAWIHSICINSVEFSNIFDILKTYDVIPHNARALKKRHHQRICRQSASVMWWETPRRRTKERRRCVCGKWFRKTEGSRIHARR
jgi:hypothetical protein